MERKHVWATWSHEQRNLWPCESWLERESTTGSDFCNSSQTAYLHCSHYFIKQSVCTSFKTLETGSQQKISHHADYSKFMNQHRFWEIKHYIPLMVESTDKVHTRTMIGGYYDFYWWFNQKRVDELNTSISFIFEKSMSPMVPRIDTVIVVRMYFYIIWIIYIINLIYLHTHFYFDVHMMSLIFHS